jgi:hypothetical protein
VSGDAADAVPSASAVAIARRWQAIDRLLPPPGLPGAGCGVELIVAGEDGQPAATGICQHWAGNPDSLELTWGAARRFQLRAAVAGPDVGNALDQLLSRWRDHLAGVPGADAADSAAVLNWPSRDIEGVAALVRHGLSPLAVIAARVQDRHPGAPAAGAGMTGQGLRVRRAGPADLDAVVQLGMEVIRYDAYFGGVTERPGTADALRREAADAAGVAVMLLHYAQVNPLSAPFWGRQDYRPLWTCWESRPAQSIR